MTTNRDWLYSLDVADLADWFDAEHVENQELALDGDTAALEAEYGKGGLVGGSFCDTPEQGEVVMPLESWRDHLDTESESEDSRERLEADVRNFAEKSGWLYPMAGTRIVLEWLDRQAAITEREVRERIDKQTNDELPEGDALGWLRKWIAGHDPQLRGHGLAGLETIADVIERDYMWRNEHERIVQEMVDANTRQCERTNELTAERDNWKANCEDWKNHARAAENACYETMLERERYRELFGMALDWAHEITMLETSIDEGMA